MNHDEMVSEPRLCLADSRVGIAACLALIRHLPEIRQQVAFHLPAQINFVRRFQSIFFNRSGYLPKVNARLYFGKSLVFDGAFFVLGDMS